jgi:hypothetical protein
MLEYNVHYLVHKSNLPVPLLIQTYSVHIQPYFLKILFNSILQYFSDVKRLET